jgi:hypothetical protein
MWASSDGDNVSVLDCVDKNISEVKSNDSDNKMCNNQGSDCTSCTLDSGQSVGQVARVVSGMANENLALGCPPVT